MPPVMAAVSGASLAARVATQRTLPVSVAVSGASVVVSVPETGPAATSPVKAAPSAASTAAKTVIHSTVPDQPPPPPAPAPGFSTSETKPPNELEIFDSAETETVVLPVGEVIAQPPSPALISGASANAVAFVQPVTEPSLPPLKPP